MVAEPGARRPPRCSRRRGQRPAGAERLGRAGEHGDLHPEAGVSLPAAAVAGDERELDESRRARRGQVEHRERPGAVAAGDGAQARPVPARDGLGVSRPAANVPWTAGPVRRASTIDSWNENVYVPAWAGAGGGGEEGDATEASRRPRGSARHGPNVRKRAPAPRIGRRPYPGRFTPRALRAGRSGSRRAPSRGRDPPAARTAPAVRRRGSRARRTPAGAGSARRCPHCRAAS